MLWYPLTVTLGLAVSVTSWSPEKEVNPNHVLHGKGLPQHPHLTQLDVVCSKEYMTVHMEFDQPFQGLVFSHVAQPHERCVHIGPQSGVQETTFRIRYDSCGTIEDKKGHFHENTIVVQFEPDILEAWDEAKRLRCEWLTDFEKSSSKPSVHVSELDVVELNFQGDDIECWMEIQEGKGPWSRQLEGLVLLGSPLTLVIAINDRNKEFDMKIKQCHATDGAGFTIPLTDERGCVSRSTLLTPFLKVRDFSSRATLLAYSYLYAFKFPDNLDVYIRCTVQVCRHGCVESCPRQPTTGLKPSPRDPENIFGEAFKSKETLQKFYQHQSVFRNQETKHHAVKIPSSYTKFSPNPGRSREAEVPNINNLNEVFHDAKVKVATYNESRHLKDETHKENVHLLSKAHSEVEKVYAEAATKVPIGGTYSGHSVHFDEEQSISEEKKIHSHLNIEIIPEPEPHISSETNNKQIHWDDDALKHVNHDQQKEVFPHRPILKQHSVPEPEPEPSVVHPPKLLGHEQTDQIYESDSDTYQPGLNASPYLREHPSGFASFEKQESGHWNIPQPEPEPSNPLHKYEHDETHQEYGDANLFYPKPVIASPFLLVKHYSNEGPVLKYSTLAPATDPAPVYVAKTQISSMNNSKQMMMMGMSSMRAMYPPSYMNSMSMMSRPRHHHYPYPVPQFSPNKAMMMLNVVADRRTDENVDDSVSTDHRQEENTEGVQVGNRQPISGFAPPVQARNFANDETISKVAPVPRILRVKRSEPVFGVQQRFRVISPADLAFEFNATADSMKILNGRREDIIYGVCMSAAGLGASVGILLFLTGFSLVIATILFHKYQQIKTRRPRTTSHFSGIFNGQVEHVYKARRSQKGPKIIEIS